MDRFILQIGKVFVLRFIFCALATPMLLYFAGCDSTPRTDYSKVDFVKAHGTIKLDGQPLGGAVVTFDTLDGQFSYGLTDSSGHYELQFDSEMAGVTPGKKIVRISTARKILGLNSDEEGGEGASEGSSPAPAEEKVPAKYNQGSELTVEVTPDKTAYDFELNST